MKKQIKRNLSRVLALFVAFVMFTTPAFAAKYEVKSELKCGMGAHTHTEDCYEIQNVETGEKELTCTNPNHTHTHTEACYKVERTLACTDSSHTEKPHEHNENCYAATGDYSCAMAEHTHGDGCYTSTLTCGLEEGEEHQHGDGCYTTALTCTQAEHTHSEACNPVKELICTVSDIPAAHHTEECYKETKTLICGMEESAHTDECYTAKTEQKKVLTCETQEHVHTAECYSADNVKTWLQNDLKNTTAEDEVVLMLNGATLTFSANGNAIALKNGQTLTIADGDVAGGTIEGNGNALRLVLVMSGSTLNLTGSTVLTGGTGTGGGAIYVAGQGSTVNISGGQITNSTSKENGGGAILAENGATVNVSGGTISGNTAVGNSGGAIAVKGGAAVNVTGGTIENNTADKNGGGIYVEGGSSSMSGGTVSNNTAVNGGGVFVSGGTFNMSGGTISGNEADYEKWTGTEPTGHGGGISVEGKGTLNLSGGTISGNKAGEGGGVFIDYDKLNGTGAYVKSGLNMTGGTVGGNTAHLGEGGGIYVKGEGTISGGKITNNVTYTYKDLGGGGIYIESGGDLKLTNAVITNNVANGLGGGIAACVHGKNVVYAQDGAAIFGNKALGQGHSEGYERADGTYNGSFTDGYVLWAGNEIFKEMAQDVFAAGDATALQDKKYCYAGLITSSEMLGGGDANWKGYTYCYAVNPATGELAKDQDGNYILELTLTEVGEDNNDVVFGNRMVFLTADASPEAIQNAVKAMNDALNGGVLISGNLSANTHGGGVANNGVLTIGTEGDFTNGAKQPEIDANKTLTNSANEEENKSLEGGEFTFDLYQVTTDAEGKKTVNKIEGASVKNEEGGNVPNFTFPAEIFKEPGTYTFQVKEDLTGDGGKLEDGSTLKYDKSVYEITIRVTDSKETIKIGDKTVEVVTLTVGEPVIKKIVDVDGNEIENPEELKEGEGIAFGNTYTPKPPEKPKDPEDPPKDPEDPPKDPEDPPKDPEDPPEDPEDPPEDPEDPPEDPEDPPEDPDPEYPPYTPEEPPYSPEYPPYTPEEPVTPPAAPVTPPTIDVPTPPVPQAELPEVPEEPEEPMEEVEEPEVPLVEEPEEEEEEEPEEEEFVEIEDPDVPLASVPMTGDNSYIWTIMTLVSGLALVCLALIKKREDKAE